MVQAKNRFHRVNMFKIFGDFSHFQVMGILPQNFDVSAKIKIVFIIASSSWKCNLFCSVCNFFM